MKKRNLMALIITGILVIPVFIALYEANASSNLPITLPAKNSFQLSSLTSFNDNWTLPIPNPGIDGLECRMAIDSNDIIHIVYVNGTITQQIIYTNSSNYTNIRKVSNNPADSVEPAIAVGDNTVYIVWMATIAAEFNIVISNSSDYFSTNLTISTNNSASNYNPDIAVDSNGIVHVVWAAPHNITGFGEIWYTNSSSNYKTITKITNSSNDDDRNPSIAVGSDNTIHIAWNMDQIFYANSTDNFQSIQTVSKNPSNPNTNPDIVATNPIFITWAANVGAGVDEIFLANSSNNWENITISKSPTNNSKHPRIMKFGDIIHIVWTAEYLPSTDLVSYANSLDNYQENTTISLNCTFDNSADIAFTKNGRIIIIWPFNFTIYSRNSTYPSSPAVRQIKSILIPMELNKPGTAMLAFGEFFNEFYIEKVEIMWSTNTGVSWNTFLMFGSGNGTKWKGTGVIPGYQYGVVLLYKYKITDKAGIEHETTQQMFYYPDTRTESIVLIIILFGVLGTLTALYLIPQTRNFFGRLFSRKEDKTTEKAKKPEVKETPES